VCQYLYEISANDIPNLAGERRPTEEDAVMAEHRVALVGRPVVWPLPGVPEEPVDPSWEIRNCAGCGCEVYMAPADLITAAALGAAIACGAECLSVL
jgi:hypothetical protein